MSEKLFFNGVNGVTGGYAQVPLTGKQLADHILNLESDTDNLFELKQKLKEDIRLKTAVIQQTFFAAGLATDLQKEPSARAPWLRELITDLQLLPISALEYMLDTKGVVRKSHKKLLEALAPLGSACVPLADMEKSLALLYDLGTKTWFPLVQALQACLSDLISAADVPWGGLLQALYEWMNVVQMHVAHLGVVAGVDPSDLAEAGWGVIFFAKDKRLAQLKQALKPLLDLRRTQATAGGEDIFRVYEGKDGYRPQDTTKEFLARQGADPSQPADPEKVPYYLLIVGSPDDIPFRFQYQLDVQYAVGRIDFGDDYQAYANYAQSVVTVEQGGVKLQRKAAFFGVANPDDKATQLSVNHLVDPLYKKLTQTFPEWELCEISSTAATKARLLELLKADQAPAFLFSASHGMEFPQDDPKGRQVRHQGALLCQDWAGPQAERGEIPADYYLSADDFDAEPAAEFNLLGMIAFFFACFGAGTPQYDEFSKQAFKERREVITEKPFVAALPQAMLSLSSGGALAVVGHIERVWGASFFSADSGEQSAVFESTLTKLLNGHPLGEAMDYFNVRYAALSTQLSVTLEDIDFGRLYDPYDVAMLWTENNDARGYVILGDPAVRLPVAREGDAVSARPTIDATLLDIKLSSAPDRPPEIPVSEWDQTPESVKVYIQDLLKRFT